MTVINEDMMDRAAELAKESLQKAVDNIDNEFATGYAMKNPALVASVMQFQESICIALIQEATLNA